MKRFFLTAFVFYTATLYANTDEQLWFGYIHQGRATNHWGYWIDLHHRTKNNFSKNLHAEIIRIGGTYYISDHLRITAGYAFVPQFPSLTSQSFVSLEHRPWQQVGYFRGIKKLRLTSWLRSEQRILQKTSGETIADGHHFRQRFRINAVLVLAFCKKEFNAGSWGMVLHNEVFVNAYSTDKVKAYDQNRAFAGLSYNITSALQLHLGYMNLFSFTSKGNEMVHAARLFAFHTLDWRKKK